MYQNTSSHQKAANIATIVACVVASGAFLTGLMTYRSTARSTAEAQAVGLFKEYLQFALEHDHFYLDQCPEDKRSECESFGYLALFMAESIQSLTTGEPAWEATVIRIVCDHKGFVLLTQIKLQEYAPRFHEIIKAVRSQDDICK